MTAVTDVSFVTLSSCDVTAASDVSSVTLVLLFTVTVIFSGF